MMSLTNPEDWHHRSIENVLAFCCGGYESGLQLRSLFSPFWYLGLQYSKIGLKRLPSQVLTNYRKYDTLDWAIVHPDNNGPVQFRLYADIVNLPWPDSIPTSGARHLGTQLRSLQPYCQ